MNAVDLLLLAVLIIAVVGGLRVGFTGRLFTWGGLAAGVLLATRSVPLALGFLEGGEPALRLFVGVFVLAATVALTSMLFQAVGARLRAHVVASRLSRVDRVAGGLAGAVAVLAMVWFLLPAAAEVPGGVAREVRASSIARLLEATAPPAPDASHAVRALIAQSRFPDVFADLQPAPVTGPPPEEIDLPPEVVDRATASTLNVEAAGCGRRYEGSAVTVHHDLALTNAHVVAGAERVVVRRPDGTSRDAVVVAFDPDRDLAVLEIADLGQDPLPLGTPEPGTPGVVIGYPGGQNTPRVAPVRVEQRRTALGRDIYGSSTTQREVLFLSATLQQGDSGSPVVDTAGSVVGIVFAISPDVRTTAYALDRPELDAILAAPRRPNETGRCLR